MYHRIFKYKDFDDREREEEALFHLSKAETMMWLTTNSELTLDQVLVELTQKNDIKRIMEIFEDLILRSYGQKSADGRRFIKSDQLREEFKQTEMYSELFMELVNDDKKAAIFVNSILPKDLAKETESILSQNPDKLPVNIREYVNSYPAQNVNQENNLPEKC